MSSAAPLPEALLMDYAAGTASPAVSLLMATHVAMNAEGRSSFDLMQTVGGALLDDLTGDPLEHISVDSVLARAEEDDRAQDGPEPLFRQTPRPGTPPTFHDDVLPTPLRQAQAMIGGDRRWRRLGYGVAATKLAVSNQQERAHLLWAKGGTGIATHRHVGHEIVLVLQGAFLDDGIRYGPGDVAVCEDGSVHTPRIDDGEDCVCLAVTEAPVHFTGLTGLILNRFCRF